MYNLKLKLFLTIAIHTSEWGGGCSPFKETVPNGPGRREWWGSWGGLGQCMEQCRAQCMGSCGAEEQQSRGRQGRAGGQRMGGDSSRKWGEQKGPKKSPPPHHCSRIGREKGQKKE